MAGDALHSGSPDGSRDRTASREEGRPHPDTDEPALSVENLSKTFTRGGNEVTAVDGVSFTVDPGEVVGLLGPNGAGKTTTIKSVLGLVLPDAGEVRIQGIDVYDQPRRAHRHVDAMLEGARNDYWRLTVEENLRYFASIRGQDPDRLADRHEELLDHLDIAEEADTAVRDLSRGMKQKVSLASVLASDVSVAFLDEPTLGLDVESSLQLRRELVRLVEKRGLTVLVSSHDMDVIEDVCDRVIIMNDGQIVVDEPVEKLLAGFETRAYRVTARGVGEATLADLRERFDLSNVDRVDGRTRFEVAADTQTFYRLTDAMEAHDLDLAGIESVQPDLAEVFVEVTGGGDGVASQGNGDGEATSSDGGARR